MNTRLLHHYICTRGYCILPKEQYVNNMLIFTLGTRGLITHRSIWTVALFIATSSPVSFLTSGETVTVRHPTRFRDVSTLVTVMGTIVLRVTRIISPFSRRTAQHFYFTEIHQSFKSCVFKSSNRHITSSQKTWESGLVVASHSHHILQSIYYMITDVVVSRCHSLFITHCHPCPNQSVCQ